MYLYVIFSGQTPIFRNDVLLSNLEDVFYVHLKLPLQFNEPHFVCVASIYKIRSRTFYTSFQKLLSEVVDGSECKSKFR